MRSLRQTVSFLFVTQERLPRRTDISLGRQPKAERTGNKKKKKEKKKEGKEITNIQSPKHRLNLSHQRQRSVLLHRFISSLINLAFIFLFLFFFFLYAALCVLPSATPSFHCFFDRNHSLLRAFYRLYPAMYARTRRRMVVRQCLCVVSFFTPVATTRPSAEQPSILITTSPKRKRGKLKVHRRAARRCN